jgi:4-diphosphocytidyl-2-C-methyl-D-erythritol kinase
VRRAPAAAKVNLALVVGPPRDDGKHEVLTVLQRIDLVDRIELEEAPELRIDGFPGDTLVGDALRELARVAEIDAAWRVRIDKRIPVAAGLGGGSSDAATALRLANETLADPFSPEGLRRIAARVGADVPFFLADGPQLGSGDGSELKPLDLPQDFWILLVLPRGEAKSSTADVYRAFDERKGPAGWAERRQALLDGLARVERPRDLAALPPNDLAGSPHTEAIRASGAFRADVSGAGPVLYGLFHQRPDAEGARRTLKGLGRTWLVAPAWYG